MPPTKKTRTPRAKKSTSTAAAPGAAAPTTPPAVTDAEKLTYLRRENEALAAALRKESEAKTGLQSKHDAANARCVLLASELDEAREQAGLVAKGLDRLTVGQRDMVRAQAMAMLASDTKEGAATAAGIVFVTAGDDLIAQAVGETIDKILGVGRAVGKKALGALCTPSAAESLMRMVLPAALPWIMSVVTDAVGANAAPVGAEPVPPAAPAAPAVETIALDVVVDGKSIGAIDVPVHATQDEVFNLLVLRLGKMVPDIDTTVSVEYEVGKAIRFTTAPRAKAKRRDVRKPKVVAKTSRRASEATRTADQVVESAAATTPIAKTKPSRKRSA